MVAQFNLRGGCFFVIAASILLCWKRNLLSIADDHIKNNQTQRIGDASAKYCCDIVSFCLFVSFFFSNISNKIRKKIKYHLIWYEVIKQSTENEVIYDFFFCQLVMAGKFFGPFLYGMLEDAARKMHTENRATDWTNERKNGDFIRKWPLLQTGNNNIKLIFRFVCVCVSRL